MTTFKPNDLLKAPSPNAITLGVKVSTYKFERDSSVHSRLFVLLGQRTSFFDIVGGSLQSGEAGKESPGRTQR